MRLLSALVRLEKDLRALEVRWALIGGLAVSAHGEPRLTRDLDIAITVANDKEADKIVRALSSRGYSLHKNPLLIQEDTGRLATVRLVAPDDAAPGVLIDLMFASSGIEPEVVDSAETREVLPGIRAPVIKLGHLLALKTLAGRPKDQTDIATLLHEAGEQDLQLATESLALITERGYHRKKRLQAEFVTFREAAKGFD